jgi:hypothetical protein
MYYVYEYSAPFINDCLQFAEGLIIDQPGYNGNKSVAVAIPLFPNTQPLVMGYSDKNNLRIANMTEFQHNRSANPKVGEAYAIIRKTIEHNLTPYHIAYVFAKDGNVNITIEADASNIGGTRPSFNMYSADPVSGNTFHDRYETTVYRNSITTVLCARNYF